MTLCHCVWPELCTVGVNAEVSTQCQHSTDNNIETAYCNEILKHAELCISVCGLSCVGVDDMSYQS